MLAGIITIGNIGINGTYIYIGITLLCSLVVYYIMKKIYKWAIKNQMLRFLAYIGASIIIICFTIILGMIQEKDIWQFLKIAMHSLVFLGICLAIFPLLHQFLLKRK
ncbi:hypothetical protein [Oceanobacillus jeddahense]|uniref:hypothetical protein n=1 Tax=Oceanobacillus jeddahense TaxID=1462527 RepID=UPI000595C657|nr:hypothetical protein [Oceanobacillus jeddahense]